MNAYPALPSRLLLEALETRTLLAADASDPFGLTADFNLTMAAVSGTGDFQGSFSTNFGNHRLVLTGNADAAVTIDLDKLPDFITNLYISSFETVNIVGNDKVETLIIDSVGSFSASGLSVTESLTARDVETLSLATAGRLAVLKGDSTDLSLGALGDTSLISDLKTLTFDSSSKSVFLISLNSEQTLNLKYLPDLVAVTGMPTSSVHVLLPGTGDPETPPVTPGNGGGTPNTPGDSQTPTTPTTPVPASPPDKLVVISLPLDEKTRAFLLELRNVLNSSSRETEILLAEYLGHPLQLQSPLLSSHSVTPEALQNPFGDRSKFDLATDIPLTSITAGTPINFESPILLPGHGLFTDRGLPPLPETTVFSAPMGVENKLGVPMHVDVSWNGFDPVALAEIGNHRNQNGSSPEPEQSLAETVRALSTYIVERVTAEFSPGQQSLVLLVDPQPTRGLGTSRKSSLEQMVSAPDLVTSPLAASS
ncbi:MAG TPA: hypothetical protein VNR00_16735 [Opitutus sp.]|nr:hypothetical protein [Opitutus sp.]